MSNQGPRGGQSADIIAEHVRANAWQLLQEVKSTESKTIRRQLARRAFQLAQIATQAELDAMQSIFSAAAAKL